MDLDAAVSNKEKANTDYLAKRFEEIIIFNEFTEDIM